MQVLPPPRPRTTNTSLLRLHAACSKQCVGHQVVVMSFNLDQFFRSMYACSGIVHFAVDL